MRFPDQQDAGVWHAWSAAGPGYWPVQFAPVLDSTNKEARRRVEADTAFSEPSWLVAGVQTAGRGRLDRAWQSKEGNFAGTLLLPSAPFDECLTHLPLAVGLAVRDALAPYVVDSNRLSVKWPNDVLLDEAKLSGILIEQLRGKGTSYFAIGIGVNLAYAPDIAQYPTQSLAGAGLAYPAVQDFVATLSKSLFERFQQLKDKATLDVISDWRKVAFGLGKRVPVTRDGVKQPATLLEIQSDGSLLIRLDDGTETRLYAGDIG